MSETALFEGHVIQGWHHYANLCYGTMNYVMLTDYYHFFFNATYMLFYNVLTCNFCRSACCPSWASCSFKKILIQLIILDINNFFGISHIYMAICGLSLHLSSSEMIHFLRRNTRTCTAHNSSIRPDEGLTLETSDLKRFTVANLRYQLS